MSVWHWLILVMVISFTVLLTCGLLLAVFQKGPGSGEAASWMQAIGSIGAIIAAVLISNSQHRIASNSLQNKELMNRVLVAQSLFTLGTWAISMMKRALDHGETGGAHGTSTFTVERLGHIRGLIEEFINPADAYTTSVALIFIHALWETERNFVAMGNQELRNHFIESTATHITEMDKHIGRLLKHKTSLEAKCYEHGIVKE